MRKVPKGTVFAKGQPRCPLPRRCDCRPQAGVVAKVTRQPREPPMTHRVHAERPGHHLKLGRARWRKMRRWRFRPSPRPGRPPSSCRDWTRPAKLNEPKDGTGGLGGSHSREMSKSLGPHDKSFQIVGQQPKVEMLKAGSDNQMVGATGQTRNQRCSEAFHATETKYPNDPSLHPSEGKSRIEDHIETNESRLKQASGLRQLESAGVVVKVRPKWSTIIN